MLCPLLDSPRVVNDAPPQQSRGMRSLLAMPEKHIGALHLREHTSADALVIAKSSLQFTNHTLRQMTPSKGTLQCMYS